MAEGMGNARLPSLPATRREARDRQSPWYYTGKPCANGHVERRFTINGACHQCSLARGRRRYSDNRDRLNAEVREYRASHADQIAAQRAVKQRNAEWRRNNPEKARANNQRWHAANRHIANARRKNNAAENKKREHATWRAWYDRNKERKRATNVAWNREHVRARMRLWQKRNRLKVRAWNEEWKRANPEARTAHAQARRARAIGSGGRYTAQDVRDIFRRQRGSCAYCRSRLVAGYHIDHITPISRGGGNDRRNIQILCAPCNLSKGASDPIDFARRIGRLL